MAYYDEPLQLLQKQVMQKKRTESKLKELVVQRQELKSKVDNFEKSMLDEKDDVNRLEGHSLAAFFYELIGKMDEKLDKERKEAYVAKLKYDVAARELAVVDKEIEFRQAELNQLLGCEQRYEVALQAKLEIIKSAGCKDDLDIFKTEEHITYINNQKKEILEALDVGQIVSDSTNSILSSLDSAEGWGTWDLIGGGLLSNLEKHSHLDEAQRQIERLQKELRHFKTELADVTINADIQVNIDGFLRFADYIFDGIFADWAVLDKINQSQTQMMNIKVQIEEVIEHLNAMLSGMDKELENEKEKLNDLIVGAVM